MGDPMAQDTVTVTIVVYDLLPEGRLSSIAYVLGLGIYHTSIRLSAPFDREYAFGGHPYPQLTGVFSHPARADHTSPLTGLRWIKDVPMGTVKIPSSKKRRRQRERSGQDEEERGLMEGRARPGSTQKELPPIPPPKEPTFQAELSLTDQHRIFSGASTGSEEYLPQSATRDMYSEAVYPPTRSYARSASSSPSSSSSSFDRPDPGLSSAPADYVQLVLQHLQESSEWRGTAYSLLSKNCNTFTSELCEMLTGRKAPGWINRAAVVGTALPCLVPADWIEPPEAIPPNSDNGQLDNATYHSPPAMHTRG